MNTPTAPLPALVVGAGPAGLASAACLQRRGIEALVLEAGPSLANSWRHHYDRLHLHTVKQQSHLPGLPFAGELPRYPSRADVVAYLEAYAARFAIAPRTGEAVRRVRAGGTAGSSSRARARRYRARAVVMAAGLNRLPNPERLPDQERFRGAVLHSRDYRNADRFAGPAGAGRRRRQHRRGDRARSRRARRAPDPGGALAGEHRAARLPRPADAADRDPHARRLPLKLRDAIGRLVSRLAFGNLARYGLARPAFGPLTSIELRRRIPLIDVGTIAAIKRGDIAVKPAVTRFTEIGRGVRRRHRG